MKSAGCILPPHVGCVCQLLMACWGRDEVCWSLKIAAGGEHESAARLLLQKPFIVVVLGCKDCNIDCPVTAIRSRQCLVACLRRRALT